MIGRQPPGLKGWLTRSLDHSYNGVSSGLEHCPRMGDRDASEGGSAMPAPSMEFPKDVSHEERMIVAFLEIRCCMMSEAETVLGPDRFPSSSIFDWSAFFISKAE